jgi:hypothetical protein
MGLEYVGPLVYRKTDFFRQKILIVRRKAPPRPTRSRAGRG